MRTRHTFYLLPLLLTGLFACQQQEAEIPLCCTKPAATASAAVIPMASHAGALSDLSLYNLSSEWTDQEGRQLKLEELQGKPQVVAMVYTSCAYACPRLTADLQDIEAKLPEDKRQAIGFVLVTMDPDRDTPEKLKAFAVAHHLDTRRWTLLTSQPDDIRELAALLNVQYAKDLNGNFSHSNLITVLNAEGEIIHQQEGLGTNPAETLQALKNLPATLLE
ncbi:SCO family protein [Pontibacter chitinilyticus]|uniref:SCO family protein n=1 Tax=Pontibacter chitinilyticus TaxID=2674989 RepID=UPI00321AC540